MSPAFLVLFKGVGGVDGKPLFFKRSTENIDVFAFCFVVYSSIFGKEVSDGSLVLVSSG